MDAGKCRHVFSLTGFGFRPGQPFANTSHQSRGAAASAATMSERKANEAACRASEGTENCPQLLHAWFEAAVRSHGDSLAIDIPIDDTNRTSLEIRARPTRVTYKQLDLMANRMSARIAHLFPTADCVAALAMPRASVYTYACQLAVLKCGGAFTTFDPKFPPERRKYIMTDSACVCVFHDPESDFGAIELEVLPPLLAAEIATRVIDVAEVFRGGHDYDVDFEAIMATPEHLTPSSLAYIIYTSGSTGTCVWLQPGHKARM